MTSGESYTFLAHGTRTGKLAVIRHDGHPHVTPICFGADGDGLVFTTWHASVKARALQRGGRASAVVDDEAPPCLFVMVEAVPEIAAEAEDLIRSATRIRGRDMGRERAGEFGQRNGVPGELLVWLHPEPLVAKAVVSA